MTCDADEPGFARQWNRTKSKKRDQAYSLDRNWPGKIVVETCGRAVVVVLASSCPFSTATLPRFNGTLVYALAERAVERELTLGHSTVLSMLALMRRAIGKAKAIFWV